MVDVPEMVVVGNLMAVLSVEEDAYVNVVSWIGDAQSPTTLPDTPLAR